nr:microtubule-associated protein TORTIFOLIA1-like [Ipomoea batatas]
MMEYETFEADEATPGPITKPPFSSIVKPFVNSIFHEQDHNSQIGASLCLTAAIEATSDLDPAELRKLLPKLYKLVKNDCFKAKPSLLSLIGSIVSVGGAANRTVLNGLVSTLVDSTRAAMAMATIERTRPVPILSNGMIIWLDTSASTMTKRTGNTGREAGGILKELIFVFMVVACWTENVDN